ncbi:uncharacterized protein LOC122291300 [Carya illinoinensis]|uniref:DEUBAD domain-containing protein n=1 Tax=Carya illinoinensis TaxID=32201 RepID=A0A8T1NPZ6_CARIL|nr:uncharacterized protein LOC122291300 [Carya illinoinensis]XP_042954909.1 uncharacterized protein LOC122291300 [Carya illinoinensis]KAG6631612.1 hypothetical protein CIPAW_13G103000 [Carya illinoinensis]KAG6631613.1 hypothetical protein CIPAW_13G103000 [Carya illinoinensis]
MAIEKNSFKMSRFDTEFSPSSGETLSSDEDELQRHSSAVETGDDDDFDDADSGAGSDDFDLLELGETEAEFCQVGSQTCSIPLELCDLPGLEDILSVDVWNESLTDEERLSLTKFLPDMDQETYMITLKEIFMGCNLHFGSPIKKLFDTLKGGLCEPRVALYREGLNFCQKRQHYHLLRNYQNNIVSNLCHIRDAWLNCRGYSIEKRLRILNIMKSEKSLMYEKVEDFESDSSERVSGERLWSRNIKDKKVAEKMCRHSAPGVGRNMDIPPRRQSMTLEPEKKGKPNAKDKSKLAGLKPSSAKDLTGCNPSVYHGLDINSGPYGSVAALPRQNKAVGYDLAMAFRPRDQMRISDDSEEMTYGMALLLDQNVPRGSVMEKSGILKVGNKRGLLRNDDSFVAVPLSSKSDSVAYSRNRNSSQLSEVKALTAKPPNIKTSYDFVKNSRYTDNVQQFSVGASSKGRDVKANRVDSSDCAEPLLHKKTQGAAFAMDSSFRADDWDAKSKRWKTKRESPDLNYKSLRTSLPQMNERYSPSELRAEPSKEKIKGNFVQNGKGNRMLMKSSDSESDSSEQFDDDEDTNPLLRSKLAFPVGVIEGSRFKSLQSGLDAKRPIFGKKNMKENVRDLGGTTRPSKQTGGFSNHGHVPGVKNDTLKRKGKMRDISPLYDSATKPFRDSYISSLVNFNDDSSRKQAHKFGKNGKVRGEHVERLHMSSLKTYPAERKLKRDVRHDYFHDDVAEDDPLDKKLLADEKGRGRFGKKGQGKEARLNDQRGRSEAPLTGCNSVTKKRKGKEDMTEMHERDEDGDIQSDSPWQVDDSIPLKKKTKRKLDQDPDSSDMENSEPHVAEMGAVETKLQKKQFTLITPTVHTGFSFSIIHLLSAVRLAMITPLPEDIEVGKTLEEQNKNHKDSVDGIPSHEKVDANVSEHGRQGNLTVQEIVNHVRSNPGDPCILETQEPLQDLVRGVLKIFSSKTAPLGVKGWKALASYEKSTKCWSWIGPDSHSSSDHDIIEEVTSPEAWSLPHKMLVKLVDSFANWLKSGQETLQQIGSLPEPPLVLMQINMDEKERFRDLRAQKSLNTISPSSEEVRSYFRMEEVLRYSVPDRAFSYTAADGRKSIVAPLRRCGGKPTSKARDHFMLKRNRPPHVTILCLVRDAAARLPGSIGTRADVCTLIRDSQYIVEDVSDAQVNQVVSGALDRLHYERDPCVQFDGERKLWVYLHREREEEDFENDGTSSTKKWKRQKKDTAEQSDQGAVTVAYHGTGDQTGYEFFSDLNVEPSCIDGDKGMELVVRQNVEDNVDMNHGSEHSDTHQGHMLCDDIGLNSTRDKKLICQENSINDDFDDEIFGRERPDELLRASLL